MFDTKTLCTLLLLGFLVKHFVADFPLQNLWMIKNKGTWLHPGGLVHSGLHAGASLLVMLVFLPWLPVSLGFLVAVALAEGLIHYLIDFSKMQADRQLACSDVVHENGMVIVRILKPKRYFAMLGFDQLLHGITYAIMIYLVI